MNTATLVASLSLLGALGACSQPVTKASPQDHVEVAHVDAVPAPEACASSCSSAHATAAAERRRVDLRDAPVQGTVDAPVTVVVFSDFECPFCARAAKTVTELAKRYAGVARIAFKQHPLPFHSHARLAAKAALAADEQGRFWQMHDALFGHECTIDRDGIDECALRAGVQLAAFHAALDSHRLEARITADEAEAQALGVEGTPTFFVNGRRITGAVPVDDIAAVIDEERQAAR